MTNAADYPSQPAIVIADGARWNVDEQVFHCPRGHRIDLDHIRWLRGGLGLPLL
jgi:hypothetical protein